MKWGGGAFHFPPLFRHEDYEHRLFVVSSYAFLE